MAKVWKNATFIGSIDASGATHETVLFTTPTTRPLTLRRTLAWWGLSGVQDGPDLSLESLQTPVGLWLQDGNSHNNPGTSNVVDSPWNEDRYDPIFTWFSGWSYGPTQSAVHVNGHTSLNLSAGYDYDLPLAQQRLDHIYAYGSIDSHAQRVWYAPNSPEFTFTADYFTATAPDFSNQGRVGFWCQCRFLFDYIS